MEGSSGFRPGHSFGGVNVILCGDLHQFPPVACGKREALYHPINTTDPVDAQVGRRIYEEFTTIVLAQLRGSSSFISAMGWLRQDTWTC